jgi:UDP-2,4-diacetamido-2,4,6-trideoxy-beta-L-altropyranose hydrolase
VSARPHVAIRVDASTEIGSGHLMRCLALADELAARGAAVRFVCRQLPEGLAARVAAHGHGLARLPPAPPARAAELDLPHSAWLGVSQADDAAATLSALADVPRWDWAVVDHYGLDARFEAPLRRAAERVLAIDDLADRPHDADALLDSGCLSPEQAERYATRLPAPCRRLFGPAWAFLRPEFRAARSRRPPRAEPPFRIVVSFGGVDPPGATLVALRALELLRREDGLVDAVDVILGSASPHRSAVAEACARGGGTTLHLDATNVAELLARADLAVGAGGVMSWERCAVGVPSIVGAIAENQRSVCEALVAGRAAVGVGEFARVDPARLAALVRDLLGRPALLERLGRRGQALVDGRGAERVGLLMLRGPLALRCATASDARCAWLWRNHPVSRRFSVDPSPIPWTTHEAWWSRSVASPSRVLLVVTSAGADVGILRYDVDGDEAVVSIYLDPALGGVGLGSVALRAGTAWVKENLPGVRTIRAVILPENEPSIRSFKAAGYVFAGGREWTRALSGA